MSSLHEKKLAKMLKAISEPNRLLIIKKLAEGEQCVCNIFTAIKLSQNLTSHHLSILKKEGIISPRKEGKFVYYSLNNNTVKKLTDNITQLYSSHNKTSHENRSCK